MPIALTARSLIVAAYLLALAFNGRFDIAAGLIAVAVLGVWVIPLIRDRRLFPLCAVTSAIAQRQLDGGAAGDRLESDQALIAARGREIVQR